MEMLKSTSTIPSIETITHLHTQLTHTLNKSRLCVLLLQEAVLQRHQDCTQEAIPSQTRLDLTTHNR